MIHTFFPHYVITFALRSSARFPALLTAVTPRIFGFFASALDSLMPDFTKVVWALI